MRILQDLPGRSLHLQETRSAGMQFGCVLLFLAPFWLVPLVPLVLILSGTAGATPDRGSTAGILGFMVFWYAIVGVMTAIVLYSSRRPVRVTLDRDAGEWTVEERGVLGLLPRTLSVPLLELSELQLSTTRGRGVVPGVGLGLQARLRRDGGREEAFRLVVDGLDKRDEVMDFAFRCGAIAGLRGYAIGRNDPREFEITLTRDLAGQEAVPPVERPSNYAMDEVSVHVELPQEVIPSFDPKGYKSSFQVQAWEPGREIRLFKPFQAAAVGCISAVLVPFAGYGAYAMFTSRITGSGDPLGNFLVGLLWTGIPLVLLAAVVWHSLPVLSVIDWASRTVVVARTRRTRSMPFDELTGVESRGVRTYHSGGKNQSSYNSYRVQTWIHAHGGAELLAETDDMREDPTTPYRCGMPLGVDLAGAMGLDHRYTDYK